MPTYRAFKTTRSEVDSIYLTADEIEALYELDLSDNNHWDLANELYIARRILSKEGRNWDKSPDNKTQDKTLKYLQE
jgi:predicted DNA-binding protein (UPF0251 family)